MQKLCRKLKYTVYNLMEEGDGEQNDMGATEHDEMWFGTI